MKFTKDYFFILLFSVIANVALIVSSIVSFIGWVFIPPIAHLFTKDGIEYTKTLFSTISKKLKGMENQK